MTHRERTENAFAFRPCDKVPFAVFNSPCGYAELGQPLLDLFRRYENDFTSFEDIKLPNIPDDRYDEEGNYRYIFRDEWGAVKEQRVYGMHALTVDYPLNNWDSLKNYSAPLPPPVTEKDIKSAEKHLEKYYLKTGWISIFEIMHSVRSMENVLADLAEDTEEINILADIICDYQAKVIDYYLKCGCDCIEFGDDYGTTESLIMSPGTWRKFFRPRYERLIKPIKKAGKKVAFHSCGQVWNLIEDFKEMGADSIWPQINLYDCKELNRKLKDLKLALTIHPDRGELMQRGTPDDIKKEVWRLNDIFEPMNGGSWFHIEADHGFSLQNTEALFEAITEIK